MKIASNITKQYGADRVLDPQGSLPQPALRLDPAGPVRPHEIEVAVELLCLDSTSHRNIRERADGDPGRMAARILEIVAERGKMHNPETESGGVLLGTVAAVGEDYENAPAVGDKLVSLGSLSMTPLRLDRVVKVDPASAQVVVEGTAYIAGRAAWAPLPDDLGPEAAIDLFDVCSAASQVRLLTPQGGTVCVLGAGHAGRLALVAARDTGGDGATLVVADVDAEAVERAMAMGRCDIGVVADLRDPLGALVAVRDAGAPPADLTVVVVNATGCESTALLLTAEGGTVLFFSMATNFSAAALAADGVAADIRMMIGGGYAPDRGAYALELARGSAELGREFGIAAGGTA